MKIVHVGVFNQMKNNGDTFYSITYKIHQGLIRNNHFVYQFSYRDIAKCSRLFFSKKSGNKAMNRRLVETCKNIQPELLILGHAELITLETLQEIKKIVPSIKIAMWFVDALFNERNVLNINNKISMLDSIFITTGGELLQQFKTNHNKVAFFPNVVDSSIDIHRNFELDNLPIDFLFCGTDKDDPERTELISTLSDRLSSLNSCFAGSIGNLSIYGNEFIKTLGQSKMGLNHSRRNDVYLYSSDRIAQLTGNGILTFTPRIPGFNKLYSENEVVYFDTLDELVEKIFYYHKNRQEAKDIARRGYQKAHMLFDSTVVTRFMIETIFDLPYSYNYGYEDEVIK